MSRNLILIISYRILCPYAIVNILCARTTQTQLTSKTLNKFWMLEDKLWWWQKLKTNVWKLHFVKSFIFQKIRKYLFWNMIVLLIRRIRIIWLLIKSRKWNWILNFYQNDSLKMCIWHLHLHLIVCNSFFFLNCSLWWKDLFWHYVLFCLGSKCHKRNFMIDM